ncbi:MAG: cytochrome c family protein [Proteobacteria bacterium]|nr:cytochrome c family protein [Pseudomonadota bacterium]
MKRYLAPVLLAALALSVPASRAADPLFALQDACVRCHLTGERLQAENSVLAWKKSVHFRAESSCSDCHGGDRLLYMDFKKGHMGLPSRGEALAACGKCHEKEAALAAARPFAFGAALACPADCVTCHGFHEVEKPSLALLNPKNCGGCHSMEPVEKILTAARGAGERMDALAGELAARKKEHLPSRQAMKQLDEARDLYASAFHAQAPEHLARVLSSHILPGLSEIARGLERTAPRKWRVQGAMVTGFLVLALVAVVAYRRKLGDGQDKENP